MPDLIVIAGPNGAGKSTAAPLLIGKRLGIAEFVNADVIAAGLAGFAPENAALEAGRIMLRRLDALAAAGSDFAFETTLASQHFARWIERLQRERGYRFDLAYLWLPAAEESVRRVAQRVRLGVHSVPEDVIRRRCASGLANLFELFIPIADSWAVYDNSGSPRLVANGEVDGVIAGVEEGTWYMIEKPLRAREREETYEANRQGGGLMGVPIDKITAALQESVRDAWRRHKALGHPIVIWRDGKVVIVPPEEIEG